MPTQTSSRRGSEHDTRGFGTQIPYRAMNEPGCYISNWAGHLLRVPEDAVKPGRSPVIEILGTESLFVTKVSNDPFLPITKARLLAADCDVTVNF